MMSFQYAAPTTANNPTAYNAADSRTGTATASGVPNLAALISQYPNAFGSRPQPIAMPQSQYQEAVAAIPGLTTTGNNALGVINQELTGNIAPSTVNQLRDQAAAYGVSSGQPGTTPGSLALNNLMRSMGMTSEGLMQHGLGDYNNFLGTIASAQTNPAVTADVNQWNSEVRSAPDPRQAGELQLALAQAYMQAAMNPAGGAGGAAGGSLLPSTGNAHNYLTELGPGTWQSGPGTYHTPYMV